MLELHSSLISPTHYPAHNSCSKGPKSLEFVMRVDPPHAGPTTAHFISKFYENCSFLKLQKNKNKFLLIPLTAQPYDVCSKGPRGLQFVMRIDPLHVGPTTKCWFKNSTKIVKRAGGRRVSAVAPWRGVAGTTTSIDVLTSPRPNASHNTLPEGKVPSCLARQSWVFAVGAVLAGRAAPTTSTSNRH